MPVFDSELDHIIALFFSDPRSAYTAVFDFTRAHFEVDRDAALRALCDKLDDIADFQCAAWFAIAAGALVETGGEASVLARAIVEPLREALQGANRMLAHAPLHHDEQGEHEVGEWRLSGAAFDAISDADPTCAGAWLSMGSWYKPAVAAWTRDLATLAHVQQDSELCAAVFDLGRQTETTYWLGKLLRTVFGTRLVIQVPELGECWSLIADGVVDMAQLSVLLAQPLAQPIAGIGATGELEGDVVEVMRGNGPQKGHGGYGCQFHMYPVEAIDPADGFPKNGRHRWYAPGGYGDGSLPPDFLIGDLTTRDDGARVLVMVGPRTAEMPFTRALPSLRTFTALRAGLRNVERLPGS
jgi:hypothetical protein